MMQSAMNKFLMVYFEIHIFEQTVFHSQVIVTANKINSKIFFPFSCTNSSFKIKPKQLTLTNDFSFLLLNIFLLVTFAVLNNKPL